MLHVVLFEPEIPQNTGNIGRLCAVTGSRLHLIHPLGFTISDKHLRRAGMDYWHALDVHHHENWSAFLLSPERPQRLCLLTTKAQKPYWEVTFKPEDGLVFGSESKGVPEWLHAELAQNRFTIPHANRELRSLNLSSAVAVTTYEAFRQLNMEQAIPAPG